jgi:hypothetical protein
MQFSLLVLVVLVVLVLVLVSVVVVAVFTSYYWVSVPSNIVRKPHHVTASQIIHLKSI